MLEGITNHNTEKLWQPLLLQFFSKTTPNNGKQGEILQQTTYCQASLQHRKFWKFVLGGRYLATSSGKRYSLQRKANLGIKNALSNEVHQEATNDDDLVLVREVDRTLQYRNVEGPKLAHGKFVKS